MMIQTIQSKPSVDDRSLLALIRGDQTREEGFRLLIRSYQVRLYNHIRTIVGSHEDTDDVLQNTFVKIFRNIEKFEEKSSLFTWIYRIAPRESLNHLQTIKNHLSIESDHISYVSDRKADDYFDEETAVHRINEAINSLPEKQKIVFHLRYYEGLSYHEISDITETSVGALKASYHHAVKKIESFLKEI
jgi:RNA polymerase sigma-70 factor (ECF subfamily)